MVCGRALSCIFRAQRASEREPSGVFSELRVAVCCFLVLGAAARASHLGREHTNLISVLFHTKHPFRTPSCEMQTARVVVNFEFLLYNEAGESVLFGAPQTTSMQSSPHQFGLERRKSDCILINFDQTHETLNGPDLKRVIRRRIRALIKNYNIMGSVK
jgi:hypothetical protein